MEVGAIRLVEGAQKIVKHRMGHMSRIGSAAGSLKSQA
jgi:hypothetical protein